ncbi:PotD/PotF family extracellular solute-binding protein [Mesorhizobium sp. M0046]|uniref:ABC transporter substrate-binding protein n=1 Tax=Mesorhizobium sp. M0046 TaxID=2956858 RepID=UPI003338B45B
MITLSRRDVLKTAASAAAFGTGISGLSFPAAGAAETITAMEWGDTYITAIKQIASKQTDVDINWQLHAGGSAAILPKIKATWPNPGIDLLTGWDVSWQIIAREGWAEPVTLEQVPNLADIPQKLLVRDDGGNIINIPRTLSAYFWYYREDAAPFEITKIDDLLDPRLAGKIVFPSPLLNSNMQIVGLALAKGGNERNMEPGWDFVKKLAQSGNIGRVANTGSDIGPSLDSGETCLTFEGGSGAIERGRRYKIRSLSKMAPETGFKTFLFQEGWCVLKGPRKDAAMKFANFAIDPENNAEFNRSIGAVPVNIKSAASDELKPMLFNNEETEKYAYIPDWSYVSEQADAWNKRWEQEVVPLLR